MRQTTSVSYIPASNDLVLLVEIFTNPATQQGGGSISSTHYTSIPS